ncbi:MAG: ABC transporter ATP-binding protein, partial [Tannerellaceae bacterium]|nr:ABC transporter ATP-binding protein [Tannerellaceae bacterium]
MREETIHLQSLAIGYRNKKSTKVIASNLTTTIYSGELTCLLGANGVGKSTLLRTLSAFQPRLEGDITIMGRSIDKYSDRRISHTLGVVLTERCDIRNMSVHELIGMGRSPYTGFWGRLRNEDRTIVRKAIEMIHIEALADRMVHTLSDGERQKVMIAKALAQETPVIFLDEPTAFLDFPSKVEIMQLLHKLTRSAGKTIFLSTHDLELALQIADKIWLMDKEKGIHTGVPEDMALNGQLNRFINREGIVFDIDSGLYRIKNQYTKQIRLTGEGQKYAMMRKALQRNGIYADEEVKSDIRIETGATDSPEFSVHLSNGRKYTVNTIEEVLAL